MRIKKLKIENFRGFRELDITFPDSNLAVFIGDNGSGKTSLLDGIAILLAWFVTELGNRIQSEVSSEGFIPKHPEYALTVNDLHVASQKRQSVITLTTLREDTILSWSRALGIIDDATKNQEAKDAIEAIRRKLRIQPELSLPVLLYYQIDRTIGEDHFAPERPQPYQFQQLHGYDNAFTMRIRDFHDFFSWFRVQEDLENEKKIKERDFDAVNKNLMVIRNALKMFLDGVTNANFSDLHVERNPGELNLNFRASWESSLVISKNGQRLRMQQLSAGEQMALLLVGDIARRLAIANPGLEDALQGSGIVLIDEIELHLHPQWQREVLPALQRTFPNLQFIVTTHSPQVLSHVKKESIFILDGGKIFSSSTDPYGRDTNGILEEVMGTTKYPHEIQELSDQYFQLMTFDKLEEAQTIRQQLAQALSSDHPIFIKADAFITRKQILGR